MNAPIQSPSAPTSELATAPDDAPIQPPWSEGFWGLWPRSEWLVFESTKTPEQVKADLRVGLGPVWDIVTPGFKGWVLGPFVRIGWLPKWYNLGQRSHLAFRGMIKATPTGSRMTGYVRMHSLLTLIIVWMYLHLVYCGGAWMMHYNARFYGWGFIISLACMLLIAWFSRIGAKAAVREIHAHLTRVCLGNEIGEMPVASPPLSNVSHEA